MADAYKLDAHPWRNRIVGYDNVDPEQLLANPLNWRVHPKRQQDSLTGALNEIGWLQDVVVNRITQHVIDGHLRVSLALRKGEKTVPVKYVELSEAEERLALAVFDPITNMAETDAQILDDLLREVNTGEAALQQLLAEMAEKASVIPPLDVATVAGDGAYREQYGVIVVCQDEAEQEKVYNQLSAEGFNCKVVVT